MYASLHYLYYIFISDFDAQKILLSEIELLQNFQKTENVHQVLSIMNDNE